MNESEVGVGPARGDFLAIAAGVFTATQLTLMDPIANFSHWATVSSNGKVIGFGPQNAPVVVLGVVLAVVGLLTYERERRVA